MARTAFSQGGWAQSSFYTFDQQGNVSQVQDASGNVTSTVLYDAYGSRLSANDSTPFGFGGQAGYYTDPETGLLLLTHRYYDPEEGRFLNRDPIGYAGGMNLYGYCGGDPVNSIDPLGLKWYDGWLSGAWGEKIPFLGDMYAMWGESCWSPQCSFMDFARKGILPMGATACAATGIYSAGALVGMAGQSIWLSIFGSGVAAKSAEIGVYLEQQQVIQGTGGPGYVYQLEANGLPFYVGRTIDPLSRGDYWEGEYPGAAFRVIAQNLSYPEMRGMEHIMIEIFGGPKGQLINQINGISLRNPSYNRYTDSAWDLFK